MEEVSKETRINLIKKLGGAINYEFALNIAEPLVIELVLALDPENEIINEGQYKAHLDSIKLNNTASADRG